MEEQYIPFKNAVEKLKEAEALAAAGEVTRGFALLCAALRSAISDAEDAIDELESRYHELDSRVAGL